MIILWLNPAEYNLKTTVYILIQIYFVTSSYDTQQVIGKGKAGMAQEREWTKIQRAKVKLVKWRQRDWEQRYKKKKEIGLGKDPTLIEQTQIHR